MEQGNQQNRDEPGNLAKKETGMRQEAVRNQGNRMDQGNQQNRDEPGIQQNQKNWMN